MEKNDMVHYCAVCGSLAGPGLERPICNHASRIYFGTTEDADKARKEHKRTK